MVSSYDEIPGQRLNVAVENNSYHVSGGVDHRAAGIAADDVRGLHDVERRGRADLGFGVHPACGQLVGLFVAMLRGVLIGAADAW